MPEIIIRNRKNLDDYLYEPNTKFSDKDAEKVSWMWLSVWNSSKSYFENQ